MRIVHIASEYAPIAKVGGLADVVSGLSLELKKLGHELEVILPKYSVLKDEALLELSQEQYPLHCTFDQETYANTIFHGSLLGIKLTLIDAKHPKDFFSRTSIYGQKDDLERFLYFDKAAVTYLEQQERAPDIIHLHDWPTAAIAPLLHHRGSLKKSKVVFTIHNLEHQGLIEPAFFLKLNDFPPSYFEWHAMQDTQDYQLLNLLKGGIVFSDMVTTVSPSYKEEILTPLGGRSLDSVLLGCRHKFRGILNGLDTDYWNPATDPYLAAAYEQSDLRDEFPYLPGKEANKRALQEQFNLAIEANASDERPLVATITRLVAQKGIHLIEHALYRTLEQGGMFFLLGSSPDPKVQNHFTELARSLESNPYAKIILQADEGLAHRIYAAADLFIVPSIFEPCGLTQLIAMRYGAIPIVRETGGLKDTVHDIDHSEEPWEKRNGYTFKFADLQGVNFALDRALADYRNKNRWKQLMEHATAQDFSWKKSAEEYVALYERALQGPIF